MKTLASRMADISDVPLSMDLFRSVHLGRNNRHYRLLIKVCEIIFLSQIPGEGVAGTTFASLLDDELRMAAIFERFVRNLYRAEQTAFKVRAEEVAWDATFLNPDHRSYLPQMRTDMTMRRPGRTLVVDTKYYREIFRSRMGGSPKLRSEHLYQLLTYLRQVRCDEAIPQFLTESCCMRAPGA
jgi:5-methylcytosine-specific restriction enzyme subunit McrC